MIRKLAQPFAQIVLFFKYKKKMFLFQKSCCINVCNNWYNNSNAARLLLESLSDKNFIDRKLFKTLDMITLDSNSSLYS